jgi:hypothetical protein
MPAGDERRRILDDRCAAAELLLVRWLRDDPPDWRSWSLARARAVRVVEANESRLRKVTCVWGSTEGPLGWRSHSRPSVLPSR